jgi:acetyl esterase/lipase
MKKGLSEIHPQLRAIARVSPKFSYSRKNLWLINRLISLIPASRAPDLRIENVFIPAEDGDTTIRLRIYTPKSAVKSMPALLWLHGGGYVLGKPEMDDRSCIDYVQRLGIMVVSIDYRHAPRHPFPAGLDDCTSALQWVGTQAEHLGIDTKRIAIGGVSAGGGLAAALAQRAHDQLEIKPIFQLLVYPMLDDRTVLRAELDDSLNVTWDQRSNRFGWESYLGGQAGAPDVPAYAVPARREDLAGLSPAWIGVGSLDIFHAEDVAYAQRLAACGVANELVIVPGAFHGFDVFNPQLPVVRDFRNSQIAALKKAFSV